MISISVNAGDVIQFLAVFFGALSVINSGMVYGWPAAALPQLLKSNGNESLHLSTVQGLWIAVAPFAAAILSAPISFSAANLLGPRKTFLFAFYPYVTSWILIALSNNSFEMLLIGRLLSGISDGCIYNVFPIYVEDIRKDKTKGKHYSIFPICFTFGIFLVTVLGEIFPIFVTATLATILPATSFLGMTVMPDSPYYLVLKNKTYQAKESLRYTRDKDKIEEEYNNLIEVINHHYILQDQNVALDKIVLSIIILITSQQLTGIAAIVFFTSTILKDGHINFLFDSNFAIIIAALLFIMSIFSALVSDSVCRKFFLILSLLGCGLSLAILGLYFQIINFSDDTKILSTVPIASLMIFVIFYGLGLQNMPFVLFCQILPRNYKPKFLNLAYIYFSFMTVLVSFFFSFSNDAFKIHVFFYLFAVCCCVNFFLVLFFIPKTRGESDEEKSLLDSSQNSNPSYNFLLTSLEISDYSD